MKNILQITAEHNLKDTELWYDLMEISETINDFISFIEVAKQDFPDRKVRIVQIIEA